MPWYDPVLPVAGTAITVPFYQQNIYEPLRDLHQRLGSGSPGAAGRVLVSVSATAGAWQPFDIDLISNGGIPGAKLADDSIGASKLVDGSVTGLDADDPIPVEGVALDRLLTTGTPGAAAGHVVVTRDIGGGTIRPTFAKLAHGDLDSENAAGDGQALHYDLASNKFQWRTIASVAGVPSGMVAMFRTAAEIPSGWSRETNLDGRIPVGAGTTFGTTFIENTNYGSSWSHGHTGGAHQHNTSGLSIVGRSQSAILTNDGIPMFDINDEGNGYNIKDAAHSHDPGTYDVNGLVDSGGNTPTSSDAWAIPSRAYVFARKS